MPFWAFRLHYVLSGQRQRAPALILDPVNWLNVVRADTLAVPANVVKFFAFWDWSDVELVSDFIRLAGYSVHPHIAVAFAVHPSIPDPASANRVDGVTSIKPVTVFCYSFGVKDLFAVDSGHYCSFLVQIKISTAVIGRLDCVVYLFGKLVQSGVIS